MNEFVEKLEDMFNSRPIHDLVTFDQDIPVKDFFEDIDTHF